MSLALSPEYSNAEIADIVEQEICRVGKENIYRILLKGSVANDMEINLSALTRRYYINEIIDRTQYEYDINELMSENENNLLGRFIKALSDEDSAEDEETRNKALHYGIEALLLAGDR